MWDAARLGSGSCRRSLRSSASMSFQSAIPWQVALRQSPPPLHRLETILNCRTMIFQRTATTPLTPCLSLRVHSRTFPPPFGLLKSIGRRLLVESVSLASILEMITIVERAWFKGQFSIVVLRPPFECQLPRRRLFIPHPRFLAPNNVYSRHTLITPEEIRKCQTKSGSRYLKTAEK
jgi:hypothetical protein